MSTMAGDIEAQAFNALSSVTSERDGIMQQVANVAANTATTVKIRMGGEEKEVDISTGAGALVLDDRLQELATMEQSAAQLVAAENRAQKDVQARMS
ncbi:MAG: hypothetical protein KKA19_02630 [Candidatus Margulisbacteria bacterium]|nr:hypothetical protein [Candidatus Margulisiibacteriota bacterium]